ncbi:MULTISPECIES: hypothetical protein [Arenibacter]|uniref:hypothetical protein n=1 Tax=Arenibacter TaxID=178469 RepID=UPI0012FFEA32|nr:MULTISPECIES: hypothetical protein [Arenibacter]
MEKRYYKPKSSDLIKILSEIEDKAGLSAYDIIPFLIKIKLMAPKGSMIEEGSGGSITDRHRNDELFKELEQLEFIRIIENKLFSKLQGQRYKTPAKECVLKVKLLPKGVDYLIEHRKKEKDHFYQKLTIILLTLASVISLSQASIGVLEYLGRDNAIYKIDIINKDSVTNPVEKNNITDDKEYNIRSRDTNVKESTPKPFSEPVKSGR